MAIPTFDKFKSVTAEGKVADYDEIADVPIIHQDLINNVPSVWGYYQHTGITNDNFNNGVIYWYDGTKFQPLQNKEALILTSGNTTTLPTVGATCFLSQESYNRDWVSGETIFGIVGYIESNTIVGRYAVVGTIYDNSPRIVVSSAVSIQGEKGEKGDKGDKGDQGIQGEAGENGIDGIDGKDAILNTTNITLTTSGWTVAGSAFVQTVSVEGVTENSNIVISPYPQSMRQYTSAGIFAAYQLSDGIKFECSAKPTDSIYVNILVLRG